MSDARHSASVVIAVLLAVGGALAASSGVAAQGDPVQRVAGESRWGTAGALAQQADGNTLWVATGFSFADALTAGATGSGPVLLVAGDRAPQATLEAAADLEGIQRVRAVGGSQVVGDATLQAVADAAGVSDVARLAGSQRFATAAKVSQQAHPDGADVAYVATGISFADALTASGAAADADGPVLLATSDTLPQATRDELERLNPSEIVVVGGEAAVGAGVESALGDYAGQVNRVAGPTRWATAAAVSQHRGLTPDEAYVATGQDFPDVLAAAPAAISADAALLLSGRDVLPAATRDEIRRLGVEQATIAGGESAVSPAVADELTALLGGDPGPTGEVTVEFFDVGQADATLVEGPEASILVDAGDYQADDVVGHLTEAGVTDELDVLALTHWDADHIGQVPEVLDAVDVSEVWVQPGDAGTQTYDEAISAIQASDATLRRPDQGDQRTVGNLTVDIVGPGPGADPTDRGDAMLSMRIAFRDARVLFTGDAEADAEQRYVDAVPGLLSAQLYQVGHHGSQTSTTQPLVDAVDPNIAVYSAGADNQFGHPHTEVLARLDSAGVDIYGTDVNGDVTATSPGTPSWTVTTETQGTPQPGGNGDGDEPAGCVDINDENDPAELERIIHIGPERATALIDHRPYDTLDQLQRIDGIGPSRVQDIEDQGLAAVSC